MDTIELTTPLKYELEARNGIRYVIDPIERPREAVLQNWGDCAIKAMALAFNRTYLDVLDEVVRRQGRHVYNGRKRGARSGTQLSVIQDMMKEAGWSYVPERRNLTSASAVARLPRRAVLEFGRHVAYIDNGVIYDGFNTQAYAGSKQTKGWWIPPFKPVTLRQALERKPELRRNLIHSYRCERDMLPSFEHDVWDAMVQEDLTPEEFDLYMQKYRRA